MHKKGHLNKHESTPLLQIKKLIYSVPWPFLFNDGSQGTKLNVAVSPLFMTGTAFSGKATQAQKDRDLFCFCPQFVYCFHFAWPLQDSGQRQSPVGPAQSYVCEQDL